MRRLPKKTVAVLVAAAAVVAGTGAAYAYWSAGGSGSGSASASTTSPVTVVQTSTITTLAPGVTPVALAGKFTNPNSGPVYVATVTASIASVTKAIGAPAGTCDATDFAITYTTGTSMPVNAEIAVGTNQGTWAGAQIAFNDKTSTNQDACKLATVTLAYTAA
jgi:hypothetical protein